MSIKVRNVTLNKEKIMSRMSGARVAQGYSYHDLSLKTGISKAQLLKMEHDFSDGTALIHVMAVSKALHIDFLYLCGLTDDYKTVE